MSEGRVPTPGRDVCSCGCGVPLEDGERLPQSGRVQWATGWYMRRRHVVNPERPTSAICSDYTGIYADGRHRGAKPRPIPPADSPEVMALPACGLCQRKVTAPARK